eukprot:1182943-Ditylum_brightwellii.AAC.1
MSNTDYDEGTQYKEALDVEQNALQQEMKIELEETEDIQHQWTEVNKKKKQQKNNRTRKPCTHRSNHRILTTHR